MDPFFGSDPFAPSWLRPVVQPKVRNEVLATEELTTSKTKQTQPQPQSQPQPQPQLPPQPQLQRDFSRDLREPHHFHHKQNQNQNQNQNQHHHHHHQQHQNQHSHPHPHQQHPHHPHPSIVPAVIEREEKKEEFPPLNPVIATGKSCTIWADAKNKVLKPAPTPNQTPITTTSGVTVLSTSAAGAFSSSSTAGRGFKPIGRTSSVSSTSSVTNAAAPPPSSPSTCSNSISCPSASSNNKTNSTFTNGSHTITSTLHSNSHVIDRTSNNNNHNSHSSSAIIRKGDRDRDRDRIGVTSSFFANSNNNKRNNHHNNHHRELGPNNSHPLHPLAPNGPIIKQRNGSTINTRNRDRDRDLFTHKNIISASSSSSSPSVGPSGSSIGANGATKGSSSSSIRKVPLFSLPIPPPPTNYVPSCAVIASASVPSGSASTSSSINITRAAPSAPVSVPRKIVGMGSKAPLVDPTRTPSSQGRNNNKKLNGPVTFNNERECSDVSVVGRPILFNGQENRKDHHHLMFSKSGSRIGIPQDKQRDQFAPFPSEEPFLSSDLLHTEEFIQKSTHKSPTSPSNEKSDDHEVDSDEDEERRGRKEMDRTSCQVERTGRGHGHCVHKLDIERERQEEEEEALSSSLEAERRFLRELGWTEEDAEEVAPLNEDEIREFNLFLKRHTQSLGHTKSSITDEPQHNLVVQGCLLDSDVSPSRNLSSSLHHRHHHQPAIENEASSKHTPPGLHLP